MNRKYKITEHVINKLNLISYNDKNFKSWVHAIWQNPRVKEKGGLRLTEKGFDLLSKSDIKFYDIKLENTDIQIDSKFILWLDNFFDCPFYITKRKIFVFDDRMAIQIVLFSGDLKKFYQAHQNFNKKQQIN